MLLRCFLALAALLVLGKAACVQKTYTAVAGEACDTSLGQNCIAGLYCDDTNVCATPDTFGANCTTVGENCKGSDLFRLICGVDLVCVHPRYTGESCTQNGQCLSESCDTGAGVCSASLELGDVCQADLPNTCPSGAYCGGNSAQDPPECIVTTTDSCSLFGWAGAGTPHTSNILSVCGAGRICIADYIVSLPSFSCIAMFNNIAENWAGNFGCPRSQATRTNTTSIFGNSALVMQCPDECGTDPQTDAICEVGSCDCDASTPSCTDEVYGCGTQLDTLLACATTNGCPVAPASTTGFVSDTVSAAVFEPLWNYLADPEGCVQSSCSVEAEALMCCQADYGDTVPGDVVCEVPMTTGEATTGEATTGEATTGEATTGEATTGDATTGSSAITTTTTSTAAVLAPLSIVIAAILCVLQ